MPHPLLKWVVTYHEKEECKMKVMNINSAKFGTNKRLAIYESPDYCLGATGFTKEMIEQYNIDPILLTVVAEAGPGAIGQYDYLIIVYDMDRFINSKWAEAIVAHEIGHVVTPLGNGFWFGEHAEYVADHYAVQLGYKELLIDMLIYCMDQLRRVGQDHLVNLCLKRIRMLEGGDGYAY
jgi:hypothetical protein